MPVIQLPGLSDGQGVYIREIGYPFRVLALEGRNRPETGVAITTEVRAKQTHYPGVRHASVQVHGTKESPIRLKGFFRDPLSILQALEVSPGVKLKGPQAMVAIIRGILYGMGPCELQWGDVITRNGRIKEFTQTIYRESWVSYDITFAIDQANEAVALVPIPTTGTLATLRAASDVARKVVGFTVEAADTMKTIGSILA